MRLLALFALLAGVAAAANPKAASIAKDADKAYRENRYEAAAALLKQAWELEPRPKYLYNMARALDQAGKLEAALAAYRAYVALPAEETEPEIAGKASQAIDRLRRLVADKGERPPPEGPRGPGEPRTTGEASAPAKPGAAAKPAPSTGRRTGAYVAGGVAVAGLGLALGFGLAANGSRAAFAQATTVQGKRDAEGATRTQAAVADVSLALGVAAAIATVVLYPKGDEAQGQVSVVLAPVRGGAVAGVGVRF